MKLPPMALTAPSLCPRCDAPAMFSDHCVYCQLQLRQCGACHGVSGPFDRYCGFCGHEMVLGRKRSPLWRLWMLAALIPLAGTLAFEVSPLGAPANAQVAKLVRPQSEQVRTLRSAGLGFTYQIPADWQAYDVSQSVKQPQPFVVASRQNADYITAVGVQGDLLSMVPQSGVTVLGRMRVDAPGVDTTDPVAVLAYQVGQLVAQPPSGMKISVVRNAHALRVDGRNAAEAVLRVTKGTDTYYFERAYVAAPGNTSVAGYASLFRVDAADSVGDWEGGDSTRIERTVQTLKFGP